MLEHLQYPLLSHGLQESRRTWPPPLEDTLGKSPVLYPPLAEVVPVESFAFLESDVFFQV